MDGIVEAVVTTIVALVLATFGTALIIAGVLLWLSHHFSVVWK